MVTCALVLLGVVVIASSSFTVGHLSLSAEIHAGPAPTYAPVTSDLSRMRTALSYYSPEHTLGHSDSPYSEARVEF